MREPATSAEGSNLIRGLDRDTMLSALMNRDPAFDGMFFAGVTTTGIFCRPVCPARKPLAKNVRFFASSKDAESAGFRACKRCMPDRPPITSPLERGPEKQAHRGASERQFREANNADYIDFEIPITEHFDFEWIVDFLAARAIPQLEVANVHGYWRCTRIGDAVTTMAVTLSKDSDAAPRLRVRATPPIGIKELRQATIRSFDLSAPIDEFLRIAKADSVLRDIVARRPGIRLPVYIDPFEGAIRAILGQQVSLAAARTMGKRLVARFGADAPGLDGHALRTFPTPEKLAAAQEAEFRELGLTGTKARAISSMGREVANGTLQFEQLLDTPSAVIDEILLKLPGVGAWTAAYIRMRALGDRDGFPASDLGVVKALARLYGRKLTKLEVESLGERWQPWRAYATLHLWASLASIPT